MMQIALFAVNGDRIVRRISYAVGLVIADHETLRAPQEVYQDIGKTRISVVEHANMQGPHDGLKYGRETYAQRSAPSVGRLVAADPVHPQSYRDKAEISLERGPPSELC